MKAVVIQDYGSPEVLQSTEIATPTVKPDQLLVKVHATSVNPVDWKIRQGLLKFLTGKRFPMVLGFDLSGAVVEVGSSVTRFQPGDEIYARLKQFPGGAYAEYAAVPESLAARKPQNMTHQEAAAVPLAALTALQALRDQGQVQAGHRVLINGASGGVGTFAVQLAKAMGAEVTAVCSTRNLDLVRSLGADRAIDYTQTDFTQDSVQYDLIFDAVSKRSFGECRSVLKSSGTYIATLPSVGTVLRSLFTPLLPGPTAKLIVATLSGSDLAQITQQIEAGQVHSVIDRTYPLSDLKAAHEFSQTHHAAGKIVITVADAI